MYKYLLLLFCISGVAQNLSRWEDYFSYRKVHDIQGIGNDIYCAAENSLFRYQPATGEMNKISKANRLNAVKPTAIAFNEENEFLIIGYASGELDFLGLDDDFNFIEIPLDDYQGEKGVTNIATNGDYATISGSYGMVLFDIANMEFAETIFFRNSGIFYTVYDSAILDNQVFSASELGVHSHVIDDFIPNFLSWQQANVPSTTFTQIEKIGNQLVAYGGGNLYRYDGNNWSFFQSLQGVTDLNTHQNHLAVTTSNAVYVYDENLVLTEQRNFSETLLSGIYASGTAFGGSEFKGLISGSTGEEIYPDGPYTNNSYSVTAIEGAVWVAPGGIRNFNTPTENKDGYFHFNGSRWYHISEDRLNNARDVVNINVNPSDTTEIYVSTWKENTGLLRMKNNILQEEYTSANSTMTELLRIGGSTFDSDGNLWVSQSFVLPGAYNAVSKRTPSGQWETYGFLNYDIGSGGVTPPVVNNGFCWIGGTRGDGVQLTNGQDYYVLQNTNEETGNLPATQVYTIYIDDNGAAWIGTRFGLRVKGNPISAFEEGDDSTRIIVIEQQGIPEALFTDTAILSIEGDNSNRKWFGTDGAGVFYRSEFGEEGIFHFTESNSPLASDTVYDIEVDDATGLVYFATKEGLMVYRGDVSQSGDSFGEVLVYPNPVRPGYNGPITVKGLANNAEVKITDVVGNLLHRDRAAGGIIQWDGTNLKGKKVATGIYFVLMTNEDGSESATAKIAIVR